MNLKSKAAILLLLALLITIPSVAQSENATTLPIDTAVRIGRLKNGLTYYIRHNAKPENKADFYIAQKVGSIQEEEHQRGLAHFLEHMCFNGTDKFPGNALRNYLESIGVKFGADLNAYTAIDETVYNINNVPVTKEGAIDSCLWILHDWADGLLLEETEIDKERGVIHEEWRQRTSANMRMTEQILPIVFPDSRYGKRLPIGLMSVVDSFPYQALRDYYEKWYRPDLQGIVIVGDIDVDQMEKKIKKIFSKIKRVKNGAERIYYPVDDNKEMIFAQATDKEQQNYSLQMMFKHQAPTRAEMNTREHYRRTIVRRLATGLLNRRIQEKMTKDVTPYLSAGVGYGNYVLASTKSAFTIAVTCKPEQILEAIPAVFIEVERARRYGFTQTELERLLADNIAGIENWYTERTKRDNNYYVNDCVRHFLDNTSLMSADDEYKLSKEIYASVTLDEVNKILPTLITDENRVAISYAPEKEDAQYPGKNDIEMLLKMMPQMQVEAYVDQASDEPLLAQIPEGGKIVNTEEGVWGSTVWTLSNGIKVVVKPTDFSADNITVSGYSKGGTNRYPDSDRLNIAFMNSLVPMGGVGSFDAIELSKKLAGSTATSRVWATGIHDRVEAGCSSKDIEKMFQLMYLQFTSPRKDMAAYESFTTRVRNSLKDRNLDPNTALSDTMKVALYNNHPRSKVVLASDVDSIDYDRVMEMYRDRTCDASDFVFVIVGNTDLATLKPYVERYIGGLPAAGRIEEILDDGVEIRKGIYRNNFRNKMETPTGTEVIIFSGEIDATQKNGLLMSYLTQILNMVYTEEVREKRGGTYGVSVGGSVNKYPEGEFQISISFNMAPERREELAGIIIQEFNKIAEDGPRDEHIEKVRSYMLRSFDESLKENGSWSHWLYRYYFDGEDVYTGYTNLVNSITKEDIKNFIRFILAQGNMIEVSMIPE
ncbi:MAG: insulinase family protein [Bacteroidaceae bacterium]|nr:insulinase family protein [Bacteroidaceae bacterium]